MQIRRVAIIFDDSQRPETTGVYCRRALETLVDVVHFRPDGLASIPGNGFDLYLNIDDGLEYHLPPALRPSAWWAIDTHLNFDWCREKSKAFDHVFAAQRDGAARLESEGIVPAEWLPLACDPDVHRRFDIEKTHDVAFVGNIFPGPRADLVRRLHGRFRSTFVGRAYFEEMARIYSASRLVFNRSLKNDVNMRVFEAVACGSLLLTNDLAENGQAELFRDGVHLATYQDGDDLLDKATYYLKHEAMRERIAAAGRAEATEKHTYKIRMQTLLERVSHSSPRANTGPDAKPAGDSAPVPGYYDFARPEVLALIPWSARRVLELGCGAGRLGEALKGRQSAHVVGIESVPAAAGQARGRLDEVFDGDVEELELDFGQDAFDCVICADVLEHLREPGQFLDRARKWLAPDGCVVASLPNVRHHSVVSSLLEGNWSYEPAGLLDETHLRFFTRRDMVDLFEEAAFEVANVKIVPGPGYEEWHRSGCPGEVRVGRLHIADTPPEEAEEFFVYQYLMVARPRNGETNDTGETNGFGILHQRGARSALATRRVPLSAQNESARVGTKSGARETGKPRLSGRALRISFLGNFDQDWSTEGYAANALEHLGHAVSRIHEYGVQSESDVIARIRDFQADCLVFFKGRIGVDPRNASAVLCPDPSRLIQLIRRSPVPAYLWYYDRVHDYNAEPARLEWMRQVAPLCRIAFVTDAGLTSANWANWRVLRQGISRPTVTSIQVPENERDDLAFVGQIYGERHQELAPLQRAYRVKVISQVFGRELSALIRRHRIIIGPRYPSAPGYWSDRIYVVLGHGGFFLAPEVEGMRDEAFVPGVHYAPIGDDVVRDVRYWLSQPEQRARIAREGQKLVLSKFTYEDRVRVLCEAIAGG